jgi:hypothetical protein
MKRLFLSAITLVTPILVAASEPKPQTVDRFLDTYQFEPIREAWAFKLERDIKGEIARLRATPGLPDSMRAAIDKYESAVQAELRVQLASNNLRPRYAAIFSKVFSEEEMIEITRFYESEVGKSSVRKRSQIAGLIQQRMGAIADELSKNLSGARAELDEAVKKAQRK